MLSLILHGCMDGQMHMWIAPTPTSHHLIILIRSTPFFPSLTTYLSKEFILQQEEEDVWDTASPLNPLLNACEQICPKARATALLLSPRSRESPGDSEKY